MRPKTTRRLRVAVVFIVAALVAVIAGSAVALATPGVPSPICFTDQFTGVDQTSAGYTYREYDINGQIVTVHFSWTADKHLTVWVTGGTAVALYIKTGGGPNDPDSEAVYGPYSGTGEWYVYHPNNPGTSGLALSHMDFCLLPECCTTTTTLPGSLLITKSIVGDNTDPAKVAADFTITVTGPGGYTWTGNFDSNGEIELTGLEPGQYVIDESDPGYPFTVTGEGGVAVTAGQQTGVTITNTGSTTTSTTEPHCGLEIIKSIEGDNPDGLNPEDFFVTVDGPGGYHWYGHFDATTGMIVLTDLEPGTYTVSEDDPGYPFTVTGEGGATVVSGQTGIVTITNTGSTTTTQPRLGSLLITKSIAGDNPDNLDYEDFEIAVTGPNDYQWSGPFDENGEIQLENLQPGTYTINEQDPGYPFAVTGEGGVEVDYGQQTGVTIINTGSTSTTEQGTTSTTTTSTTERVTTTAGSTTTEKVTTTDPDTSTTAHGWVYEPDDIQTGLGGTAGGNNWAFMVLVFASTLLVGVLAASALGVRAGVL